MGFALVNLDTGLFFDNGLWAVDHKMAQLFPDKQSVCEAALKSKLPNVAAALIEGDPPQVRGYFWTV